MPAKIISIPKIFISGDEGPLTADEFIAYCARVSNPNNQLNTMTAPKLLRYLAKHRHWSPFEMISVTMEITTTRDIAHQIIRHRSFSFQEFSQRYANPTDSLGFETREARLQDYKNRQNSIETDDVMIHNEWLDIQDRAIERSQKDYDRAIALGLAKEQARAILPEGLTVTRLYMAGTLRSWIHFCQLRCGNDTQKEHREIALDAWYQITETFPSLKDALDIGQ